MRYTLKRSEVLRGAKDFQEVFTKGKKINSKFLRCYVLVRQLPGEPARPNVMAGFVTRRTLRRAVDRNRIKRLMREAYRLNKEAVWHLSQERSCSVRAVFLYSPPLSAPASPLPSFSVVEQDMKACLRSIAAMGVTTEPS